MGWSTWCTSAACDQPAGVVPKNNTGLHDFCDEALVLSSAQALVSTGLRAAGYDHVLIDDCWAHVARDANGSLMGDPARFPHGMAWLVAQVHALGLKIGLYTSVGPQTCSSGNRTHPIPGSYGHYEHDALTFAAWGVDEVTLDWCDWTFNDTVLIPTVATQQFGDALNATGRPIWFLFHCIGYDLLNSTWCADLGNSYTIWQDHHDDWGTTISNAFFLGSHPDFVGAQTLTWPDPDFLMTGGAGCNDLTPGVRCPGMSDDEYRSEFTLWALAGGQLVVSTDIRGLSPLQAEVLLNAELLAVFNDSKKELGSLVHGWDALGDGVTAWARPLADGCVAAALLNGGAAPSDGALRLEWLPGAGWGNGTRVTVRDLWAHADEPDAVGIVPALGIRPHATVALRLCAAAAGAGRLPDRGPLHGPR